MTGGPASSDRSSPRYQQIVDAAARLFRRQGYTATTMQDVAGEVGLLKGSLYHHVDAKEDLLAEILTGLHRDALDMLGELDLTRGTALERAEAYVRAQTSWALRHIDRLEIFLREFQHLPEPHAKEVADLRDRFATILTGLIAEGQREGAVDPQFEPRVAAHGILGMMNWLGQWYRPGHGLDHDEVVEQVTRQAIGGLVPCP